MISYLLQNRRTPESAVLDRLAQQWLDIWRIAGCPSFDPESLRPSDGRIGPHGALIERSGFAIAYVPAVQAGGGEARARVLACGENVTPIALALVCGRFDRCRIDIPIEQRSDPAVDFVILLYFLRLAQREAERLAGGVSGRSQCRVDPDYSSGLTHCATVAGPRVTARACPAPAAIGNTPVAKPPSRPTTNGADQRPSRYSR